MRVRRIALDVSGGNTYGSILVEGFCSDRTALEVGADFAEVLRKRFPGSTVRVLLDDDIPQETTA